MACDHGRDKMASWVSHKYPIPAVTDVAGELRRNIGCHQGHPRPGYNSHALIFSLFPLDGGGHVTRDTWQVTLWAVTRARLKKVSGGYLQNIKNHWLEGRYVQFTRQILYLSSKKADHQRFQGSWWKYKARRETICWWSDSPTATNTQTKLSISNLMMGFSSLYQRDNTMLPTSSVQKTLFAFYGSN